MEDRPCEEEFWSAVVSCYIDAFWSYSVPFNSVFSRLVASVSILLVRLTLLLLKDDGV